MAWEPICGALRLAICNTSSGYGKSESVINLGLQSPPHPTNIKIYRYLFMYVCGWLHGHLSIILLIVISFIYPFSALWFLAWFGSVCSVQCLISTFILW